MQTILLIVDERNDQWSCFGFWEYKLDIVQIVIGDAYLRILLFLSYLSIPIVIVTQHRINLLLLAAFAIILLHCFYYYGRGGPSMPFYLLLLFLGLLRYLYILHIHFNV